MGPRTLCGEVLSGGLVSEILSVYKLDLADVIYTNEDHMKIEPPPVPIYRERYNRIHKL